MKKKFFSIVSLVLAIVLTIVLYLDISYRCETADLIASWQEEKLTEKQSISNSQVELATAQANNTESQKIVCNKNSEVQNYCLNTTNWTPLTEKRYEMYEQCFLEMTYQAWGLNLLYCEELEFPVIRTVSDSNWNLINDVSMVNFSTQELDDIQVSLCSSYVEITDFCYLPTNDTLSLAKNPPESGWIEISPDSNGKYTLPLNESEKIDGCRYTAIKYVINDCDIYYGIIATGLEFQ